jgi:hypothetical protein
MSILDKLTEGIVNRDMRHEGAALLSKWEQTGLLEGINNDSTKNGMARLLENQAKELLREAASTMSGGDVEGFASVAFPIVRRVFGSLIANDLVSVQPMSLPSGLIFFLDFTFEGTNSQSPLDRLGFASGSSLYGGNVVGSAITGGVDLNGNDGTNAGQFYNLTNGYSSPTGSVVGSDGSLVVRASGTLGAGGKMINNGGTIGFDGNSSVATLGGMTETAINEVLRFDPDLTSGSMWAITEWTTVAGDQFNFKDLAAAAFTSTTDDAFNGKGSTLIRRLSQMSQSADGNTRSETVVRLVSVLTSSLGLATSPDFLDGGTLSWPQTDQFDAVTAEPGAIVGATAWGLENTTEIPEINLKVDSVSVTAQTKKLKAKWTPELGQDLNAYHNLDAEVELTSILSEQIALEIDREIVEDLVKGATGATYYWSRSPGLFVNRNTGVEVGASSAAPDFTGTVSEWYETLLETVNDVSAAIHRKTLRGGANFIVTSPEVANILEFTSGFRANVSVDDNKGIAGTQNVGSISKRYDVFVDPYFPRNLLLVGRKGNSFLESGYVYAPYVPLQVTPTIFGTEDFVPRKGVMTRYAKKMVRPDMYGLVIVRGLMGESGGE